MATFLQKLRTVTLGTAHDLLDHAIDMNSPSALRQSIRDFEEAQAKLETETAVQEGQVRTITREIGDLEHNISSESKAITTVLAGTAASKEKDARAKGQQVVLWQKQLAEKQANLQTQQDVAGKLNVAVNSLSTRHGELVARLRQLESLSRETKAKEQAAGALTAAGSLMASGADIGVDDIEARLRQRHDVADAKLDRALGSVHVDEDPETASSVDDLLNKLRPETAVAG